MNRAKRFLSILLTLCMVLGMCPSTVFAVNSSIPFTDVAEDAWYRDAVVYVYENGLMGSTSTTGMVFSPAGVMSRAQVVTILHRMEGAPVSGETGTFTDVPAGQWYSDAVAWAAEAGVTSGTGDGTTFDPNAPVTREQLAAMLYRYAVRKGYDVSAGAKTNLLSYADASEVSEYAILSVQWAVGAGVIMGIARGGAMHLAPQGTATRAEAAVMLMRFSENLALHEEPPGSDDGDGSSDDTSGGGSDDTSGGGSGDTSGGGSGDTSGGSSGDTSGGSGDTDDGTTDTTIDDLLDKTHSKEYDNGDVVYEPQDEYLVLDEEATTLYYDNLLTVYLLEELSAQRIQQLLKCVDGTLVTRLSGAMNVLQMTVTSTDLEGLKELADVLMEDSAVLYATYDMPMEISMATSEANSDDTGSAFYQPDAEELYWWMDAIDAQTAWSFNDLSSAIDVGILDSGFDTDHVELNGKMTPLPGSPENTEDGHGTAIASIIAAKNNGNDDGLRGVADKARLIYVDHDGLISTGKYLVFTKQMIEQGLKIVNNSWGQNIVSEDVYYSPKSEDGGTDVMLAIVRKLHPELSYENYRDMCIRCAEVYGRTCMMAIIELLLNGYKDFLIVESAGNGYSERYPVNDYTGYDASWNGYYCAIDAEMFNLAFPNEQSRMGVTYEDIDSRILVVGATTNSTTNNGSYHMWTDSNYGNHVDIVAPGDDIYCATVNNGYMTASGTSGAAPMVAGAAALLKSMDNSLSMLKVRSILLQNVGSAVGVGEDDNASYKMLNIGKAVEAIASHVTVNVTDKDGKFLEDAKIEITDKSKNVREATLVKNDDGSKNYQGNVLDDTNVLNETIEIKVAVEGYITQTKTCIISGDREYSFVMEPCEIIGTVKSKKTNDPIEGASVILKLGNEVVEETQTQENGSFRFEKVKPGDYTLLIKKAYHKNLTYSVRMNESESVVILDDLLLELADNGIQGTVVDKETGKSISGASVTVSNASATQTYTATTSTDGTFLVEIEEYDPTTWTVTISAKGYEAVTKSVYVWANLEDIGTVELQPANYYIVSFDANGGSGTMDDISVEKNKVLTLPACTFTAPEGKIFKAWQIDGVAYPAGSEYSPVTSNITVRAVWSNADIPDDVVVFNGHSYYIYTISQGGSVAETYCKSLGGHLATITSAEENAFLYSYINSLGYKNAFFGFTDSETEGVWKWTTGETALYRNWHSGEPSSQDETEDWAMFYEKFSDGSWNDGTPDADKDLYICEWDFILASDNICRTQPLVAEQNQGLSPFSCIAKPRFSENNIGFEYI